MSCFLLHSRSEGLRYYQLFHGSRNPGGKLSLNPSDSHHFTFDFGDTAAFFVLDMRSSRNGSTTLGWRSVCLCPVRFYNGSLSEKRSILFYSIRLYACVCRVNGPAMLIPRQTDGGAGGLAADRNGNVEDHREVWPPFEQPPFE
jgi:hypothetical protein